VTAEERALTSVPSAPGARAAYLFREGRVKLSCNLEDGVRARVEVAVRLKVLTEEGKDLAQVEIYHGRYLQLEQLTARTISPDGLVTPVPSSAIFRQRLSDRERYYSTRLAFPKVEVGSILDYRYELDMEDVLFLEPWTFHQALPTLRSTVVFAVPSKIRPREVLFNSFRVPIEATQVPVGNVTEWRFAARDLPALVAEPFGVPSVDLASSVLLEPAAVTARGSKVGYPDGWERVLRILAHLYSQSLPAERFLKRRVDELLRGLPATDDSARARRLFHHVRDEIDQAPGGGVFLEPGTKLEAVVGRGTANAVEKAVLLDALLTAAGFDTWLAVASPLEAGTLKTDVAAFWQLERLLAASAVQARPSFAASTPTFFADDSETQTNRWQSCSAGSKRSSAAFASARSCTPPPARGRRRS
jgi:hypothetical protein